MRRGESPPFLPLLYLALTALIGLWTTGDVSAADLASNPDQPKSSFFSYSDTSVSYWNQFAADEPGVGTGINKNVISLTHFDVWQYGTNFVNVDLLLSDDNDPSRYGDGAVEVYGFFRSTLSGNALLEGDPLKIGPLKDIGLYVGADANAKNTEFGPEKRSFVAGLQFTIGLIGSGYLNLAPVYYKEFNHNGITEQDVEFDGVFRLEADYAQPLGDLPLTIRGYTNVTMPKGTDGFGAETKTEFHTENRIVLDLGEIAAEEPGVIDVFAGFAYWQNKFGSDHTQDTTGGSTESTGFAGITWHMF